MSLDTILGGSDPLSFGFSFERVSRCLAMAGLIVTVPPTYSIAPLLAFQGLGLQACATMPRVCVTCRSEALDSPELEMFTPHPHPQTHRLS